MARRRFATFLALSALAATVPGQDPLVGQAKNRITAVETALPALRADDRQGAQKLLADLEWARKRLHAAYKKDTAEWRETEQRLAKATAAVQGQLVTQPKDAGGGKETPAGGLDPQQAQKLQQLAKEVDNGFANLKLLNKGHMGDSFRRNSTQREIARLRTRLAEFPAADAAVGKVRVQLDAFEQQFTTWVAQYEADAASAQDLGSIVEELAAKYRQEQLPGPLHWPFEQERLATWAARSRELLAELPTDLQILQQASEHAVAGRRAKDLLPWLRTSVQPQLVQQVANVRQQCEGAVDEALRVAKGLREIALDDRHSIVNRVLGEGALERSMAQLQDGLTAVDLAATLDLGLAVTGGPDRAAQRQQIEATVARLQELAKAALDQVRLPKGAPLAADDRAKWEQVARDTVQKEKYGAGQILRLVVTSKVQTREKTEGVLRRTNTGATLTSYHYVWQEFSVTTAEKFGEEVWLWVNLLKFYEKSDGITPQGEWIVSRRFRSTQILAGNLDG